MKILAAKITREGDDMSIKQMFGCFNDDVLVVNVAYAKNEQPYRDWLT